MQASQYNFMHWEVFGADPPEGHLQAPEGQEGGRDQPVWIYKGKSCLTNLIAFSDEMTGSEGNQHCLMSF